MSSPKDCPYCSSKVKDLSFLESDHFRTIYNPISVVSRFAIIIPKKHVSQIVDLNNIELSEMMRLSKQSVKILQHVFNPDSYRWLIQGDANNDQLASHIQIHLIPENNQLLDNTSFSSIEYHLQTLALPQKINRFTIADEKIKSAVRELKSYVHQLELSECTG